MLKRGARRPVSLFSFLFFSMRNLGKRARDMHTNFRERNKTLVSFRPPGYKQKRGGEISNIFLFGVRMCECVCACVFVKRIRVASKRRRCEMGGLCVKPFRKVSRQELNFKWRKWNREKRVCGEYKKGFEVCLYDRCKQGVYWLTICSTINYHLWTLRCMEILYIKIFVSLFKKICVTLSHEIILCTHTSHMHTSRHFPRVYVWTLVAVFMPRGGGGGGGGDTLEILSGFPGLPVLHPWYIKQASSVRDFYLLFGSFRHMWVTACAESPIGNSRERWMMIGDRLRFHQCCKYFLDFAYNYSCFISSLIAIFNILPFQYYSMGNWRVSVLPN